VARLPSDVTGLIRWARADSITGVADGGTVTTQLPDRISGSYEVAAGVTSPTFVASSANLNSRAALAFTSGAGLIGTADLTIPSTYTVWAVAYRTGGNTNATVIAQDKGSGTANRVMQVGHTSNTSARFITFTGSSAAPTTRTENQATTISVAHVLTGSADAGSATLYVDGASDGATTSGTTLGTPSAQKMTVGRIEATATVNYFAGQIAEWGVYDHPLTNTERQLLHSYVQDRYGITVSDYVAAIPQGSGSGTWTFVGTAVGTRAPNGSGTGDWQFNGAATGARAAKALGGGAWNFQGAATGSRAPKGVGAGTWSFTGTAAGSRAPKGNAAGEVSWVGAATGTAPASNVPQGSGAGTVAWTGTAVGKRNPAGSGSGTAAWTGSAIGQRRPVGFGAGDVAWAGTTTGRRKPHGPARRSAAPPVSDGTSPSSSASRTADT
jgi:hypothetical protein